MNWVSDDFRGLNLKKVFGSATKALKLDGAGDKRKLTQRRLEAGMKAATKAPAPWFTDIPVKKPRPPRYIKLADRPTGGGWDFRVHLAPRERRAADQFHHDWVLAGLGRQPYHDWKSSGADPGERDGTFGRRTPKRVRYAEFDKNDPDAVPRRRRRQLARGQGRRATSGQGPKARSHEGHVALTEAELRDMAKPRGKSVEQLITDYLADGGTVKHCPAFVTTRSWRSARLSTPKRGLAERVVEYCWPQGAPLRDVKVCDQPHAMPLHWSQARRRRIWRWARRTLKPDEASLVEDVVLRNAGELACRRPGTIAALKAALRKLADHYEKFSPVEDLMTWEDNVRRNLEQMGVPV